MAKNRKNIRITGKSEQNQVENKLSLTTNVPDDKDLTDHIFRQQLYLSKQDMGTLIRAITSAESIQNPIRRELYAIYKKMELDAQVTSLVQTRKLKVLGKDFELVTKQGKGKRNDELTNLFQGGWFLDTLSMAWDSILYGYSLIQVGDIIDGRPSSVSLIPRENVKPEFGIVTQTSSTNTGVSYLDNEFAWGCGDPHNLGLMAKISILVTYKQHAQAAWAQMVELYGMPLRIGKIDMTNEKRVSSMFKMLVAMTSAGAGVIDKDEEVEFVEGKKGGGESAHKTLINYLDEQISKLIFGQTMMSDNGSSRSQSEVHERVGNDYVLADMKWLERVVNDVIIPKMIQIGYVELKNVRFQFVKAQDNSELFTQTIQAMSTPNVNGVDMEWFEETFGIKFNKEDKKDGLQGMGEQDGGASKSDTEGTDENEQGAK